MIRIAAATSPGEIRIALLDGDILRAYAIWRPGTPDGLGDIHIGRIATRVPAMAGAFVETGGTTGFLPDSEGAAGRPEGSFLSARITRTPQGGKGPRLSVVPGARPDGPPRLIQRGPGPLLTLAAVHPDCAITVDDPAVLAQLRPVLGERLHLVARVFDDSLVSEIEALASPQADLPGGMRATISPTPALTAIDLDGGSTTAARGDKAGTQMQANRAVLPALARQIVLRNLSGAILVDLAGIPVRRRAALAPVLEAALAADPARPRLLGFSHLGFAEILRPRSAAPLHEMLAGAHAAGLAALRHLAAEPTRLRPMLRAAPAVAAALQADAVALPDLARRLTHPLILRTDPALPRYGWTCEEAP